MADGWLTPQQCRQNWTDLIRIAKEQLAIYPDCIATIMTEHDDGLKRVIELAKLIAKADACDPMTG